MFIFGTFLANSINTNYYNTIMGINKTIKRVMALTMLSMAYSNGGIYGIPRAKRVDRNNYKANIKKDNKELREYKIKGQKVMAYSKKDAIKRLNHKNNYGKN